MNTPPTSPADLSQLRDITGIEQLPPLPAASQAAYWLAAGAFLLLLVLVAAWRWLRRPRPERSPLPDEWARRELDRIEALKLPDAGDTERYATLISQVIRRYLQLRFSWRVPQQTTVEFLEALRRDARLSPDQQAGLRGLFERCDLAKFAPAALSPEECRSLLGEARAFVEQAVDIPPENGRVGTAHRALPRTVGNAHPTGNAPAPGNAAAPGKDRRTRPE
jgi:hypothetical protein